MGGKRTRLSGKAEVHWREGPSGEASPGIWGENSMRRDTPGAAQAPGGREQGSGQGSEVFEGAEQMNELQPKQFPEFEHDVILQQPPRPRGTGLLRGDTGTEVGSDELRRTEQGPMAEVFRRALGTMVCKDKMRSNMGEARAICCLCPCPRTTCCWRRW